MCLYKCVVFFPSPNNFSLIITWKQTLFPSPLFQFFRCFLQPPLLPANHQSTTCFDKSGCLPTSYNKTSLLWLTGFPIDEQKSWGREAMATFCQWPGATKANLMSYRKPLGSSWETSRTTKKIGPCCVFLIIHRAIFERALMKS